MIPETNNTNQNNTLNNNHNNIQDLNDNNIIQAILDDTQNEPKKETQSESEFKRTNDKLEELIAQFENKVNKTEQPQDTSENK